MMLAFNEKEPWEFVIDDYTFEAYYDNDKSTVVVHSKEFGTTVREQFYGITRPQFITYSGIIAQSILEEERDFKDMFERSYN